ncbi:MAG: hypothetical protein A2V83_00270 [Nitrospirae bacterium RBG_16_64_22]|nr:MAG: hypothetical protein A2V83_00270 [Nitrospirae bacterium RBG_16_64_22]
MSPPSRLAADAIVRVLRHAGYEACLVGGCVRDHALNVSPVDFDVATSASVDAIRSLFPQTVPVGAAFGTVLVIRDGASYQVSTFRGDGTARGDALRRDFTINAMFLDPETGEVIDFAGGRDDLAARIVRSVGSAEDRFAEDPVRILRMVRLAAALRFSIAAATEKAAADMTPSLSSVSPERIRDELVSIFTGPDPVRGLDLLDRLGILSLFLPEVEEMKGVAQPPAYHPEGDVYAHTRLALSLLKEPSTVLVFGVLFHDLGKPATMTVADRIHFYGHEEMGAEMARKICSRLKFSNADTESIVLLVRHHGDLCRAGEMRPGKLARMLDRPTFEEEMELHRVDALAGPGDLSTWEFLKAAREARRAAGPPKAPLLTGKDLIEIGFAPGPVFREILESIEEEREEGGITGAEEAREWVLRRFGRAGRPAHPVEPVGPLDNPGPGDLH